MEDLYRKRRGRPSSRRELMTQMIKGRFSVEILGRYLHWGDGGGRGSAYGDAAQRAPCRGMHVA